MQRPPTAATPVSHAPAAAPSDGGTSPATVPTVRTRLELPTWTIVKVVLVLAVIWLLSRLWTLLLLLFIAALLAAALEPVVSRLDRRGWPRPLSVALIVVALVAAVGLIGLIVIPPAIREGEQLAQDLPHHVERAQGLLDANPAVLDRLRDAANRGAADPGAIAAGALRVGAGLIEGIVNVLVLLVLTIYLLLDGRRVVAWALRYVPAGHRNKVHRILPEISTVVSGYVIGQVITSVLFGVVAFAVLTLAGVPQAVLLAVLAAVMDAIPIAGILIATVPAVLLALTVSWTAAGIVLLAYVGYQQVENYLIVPRVYRNTLRISSLAVLIAVLIGGELLGIVGVLLALPVAAAVPVIERVWREEPAGATAEPVADG